MLSFGREFCLLSIEDLKASENVFPFSPFRGNSFRLQLKGLRGWAGCLEVEFVEQVPDFSDLTQIVD